MVKVLLFRFQKFLDRLPCYLSKGPPKGNFLEIYVTSFCGVRKFKNTSAMKVILFLKCSKLNLNFEIAEKN